MQEQDLATQPDGAGTDWSDRGAADGPVAFRAVIRTAVEGAQTGGLAPGSRCASLVLGLLSAGDATGTGPLLVTLMETKNHREWFQASSQTSSFDFMEAYGHAFVAAFLEAAAAFGSDTRTVDDLLAEGSATDELPWRGALVAIERLPPAGITMPTLDGGQGRPRFVIFQYVVSLGIVSFKRTSGVKIDSGRRQQFPRGSSVHPCESGRWVVGPPLGPALDPGNGRPQLGRRDRRE